MAIEQTSINMSGKWVLATPLTIAKLQTEIAAFAADTSMGLAKNEKKKTVLKVPVYVYDANSVEKGAIDVNHSLTNKYADALTYFEESFDEAIEFMAGEGATAARAADEENWTVSFSCQKGDDTFQMIFHKDCLVIQNYSNNATKTALETYFGNRPDLAQAQS